MSALSYLDREQPRAPAMDREEYVEMEARANHDLGRHRERFGICKRGCWTKAEAEVDRAITEGRLRMVATS